MAQTETDRLAVGAIFPGRLSIARAINSCFFPNLLNGRVDEDRARRKQSL